MAIIPIIKYIFDRHRRTETRKDGTGTVEMRIMYDGQYQYMSTGISVQKERWDAANQMVVGIVEAKSYNLILARLKAKTMEIIADMEKEGIFDLKAIPKLLKAPKQDMTFLDFIEYRIEQESSIKSYNTLKNHLVFLRQITAWGKIKLFRDVTPANIQRMDEWLRRRGLHDETVYGYHKHLRQFVNDAVREGFIRENPYTAKRIKLKHGTPNIRNFVTEGELRRIMDVELGTERLRNVRDLFVFQSFTGMAYADLDAFDFTKVHKSGDVYVLDGIRKKTKVPYHFVILDEAVAVLERHSYRLPKLSNQKYNDALKTLAEKCDIDKQLTSHYARRTAGMIMLNNGVPMEVVSRILGHASTRTTEKAYAFLLDKTIDDAMVKFSEKMKKKGGR